MMATRDLGLALLCLLCTRAPAQDTLPQWEEVSINLPFSTTLRPVPTHEVTGYPWSVGGETMDRDYTLYDNWKEYVEPLGITQIRLQSGWAKTEKVMGEYDFAWLDHIVRDLVERGVKPWISLSYGNELYRGGGGIRLSGALPSSGEAYRAWQDYVRATVDRYADVVDTWEVWNEPNNSWKGDRSKNRPEDYAKLLIATGDIIRERQPEGTIIAFAVSGVDADYVGQGLAELQRQDKFGLVDLVAYHPYSRNPDDQDLAVERLRDTVAMYSDRIGLYQGENGAPSEYRRTKALNSYPWTELSQAKWFLRRALNDRAHGIGTNIFSIVDLQYPDEINRKGLLLTDGDKQVVRPKHAYRAVQHMVSVFDVGLERMDTLRYTEDTYHGLQVHGFERDGAPVVALWFSDNVPSDYNGTTAVDFTFADLKFDDPVYVDLRTGVVYDISTSYHRRTGAGHEFYDLPVYDSPLLIAERRAISSVTAR